MKRIILIAILALGVIACTRPAHAQGQEPTFIPPWGRFVFLYSGGSSGGGGVNSGAGYTGFIPVYNTDSTVSKSAWSIVGNDLSGGGNKIINIGDATTGSGAATLSQVDTRVDSLKTTAVTVDESGVPSEGWGLYNDVGNQLTATTNLQVFPSLVAGTDLSMDANEITNMAAGTTDNSAITRKQGSDSLDANQRPVSVTRLADATGNVTISMAAFTWTTNFTTPTGGIEYDWLGAASGHLFTLSQNTGNPTAGTHLLHVDADDPDVVTGHFSHSNASGTALLVTGPNNVVTPTEGTTITNTNAALTVGQPADTGGVQVFGDITATGRISAEVDSLLAADTTIDLSGRPNTMIFKLYQATTSLEFANMRVGDALMLYVDNDSTFAVTFPSTAAYSVKWAGATPIAASTGTFAQRKTTIYNIIRRNVGEVYIHAVANFY